MNPYLKNVKRIEFSVTHRCRSQCAHCSLGADRVAGELPPGAAVSALEAAASLSALESVLTIGGEEIPGRRDFSRPPYLFCNLPSSA